jgi:hypothetical protein
MFALCFCPLSCFADAWFFFFFFFFSFLDKPGAEKRQKRNVA